VGQPEMAKRHMSYKHHDCPPTPNKKKAAECQSGKGLCHSWRESNPISKSSTKDWTSQQESDVGSTEKYKKLVEKTTNRSEGNKRKNKGRRPKESKRDEKQNPRKPDVRDLVARN